MSFELKDNIFIAKERVKESAQILVETDVSFLKTHNGLRPGQIHLFLGLSGGGKSTIFKTLMLDCWKQKKSFERPSVWYSEESESDFSTALAKMPIGESVFQDKSLQFFSEIDHDLSKKQLFMKLKEMCENSSILFFDNLTTSKMYSGTYEQNDNFIMALKKLIVEKNIPLVMFAHTDAKAKEGAKALIQQNDIRGQKTIVNHAQFIYILQQFHIGNDIKSTLRLVKHRAQEPDHKLYLLNYNPKTGVYDDVRKLYFTEFRSYFEQRNKL